MIKFIKQKQIQTHHKKKICQLQPKNTYQSKEVKPKASNLVTTLEEQQQFLSSSKMSLTEIYAENPTDIKHKKIINIIPTNQIKCKNCLKLIPFQDLHQHTQSHISAKYRKPKKSLISHKRIEKIDLHSYMDQDEEETDQNNDFQMRSFAAEEMPTIEIHRKNVLNLGQNSNHFEDVAIEKEQFLLRKVIMKEDSDDNCCQITIEGQESQLLGDEEIQIEKRIKYPMNRRVLTEKKLNYYENQNKNNQGHTNTIKLSRKQQSLKSEEESLLSNQGYEIQNISKDNEQSFTVVIKSRMKPGRNTKLNLCESQNYVRIQEETQSNQSSHWKQFQCPGCSGFYCKVCGSDIPPQYRPANRKLNKHQFFNQILLKRANSHLNLNKCCGI